MDGASEAVCKPSYAGTTLTHGTDSSTVRDRVHGIHWLLPKLCAETCPGPRTTRPVSRRSTPERIDAARRAAVLSRLTQERRLSEQRAEALVTAWEVEGDSLAAWSG